MSDPERRKRPKGRRKDQRKKTSDPGPSLRTLQLSSALGVAAAIVVAVGINILAARNRW